MDNKEKPPQGAEAATEENASEKSNKDAYQLDPVQKLDEEVKETEGLMRDNVEALAQRGENLDELQDKSATLENDSKEFKKTSKKINQYYCFKNLRRTLLFVGVLALIVAIIIVIIVLVTVKPWESDGSDETPGVPATLPPEPESTPTTMRF